MPGVFFHNAAGQARRLNGSFLAFIYGFCILVLMQEAWDYIAIFFLTLAMYVMAIGLFIFIRYKVKGRMYIEEFFKLNISNIIIYIVLLLLFAFLFVLLNWLI